MKQAALVVFLLLAILSHAHGQAMGARPPAAATPPLAPLAGDAVDNYITIEGSAEIRVKATSIRVVFAVTNEGSGAEACRAANEKKRRAFVESLGRAGFAPRDIAVDFISMLPVYEWVMEERNGQRIAVEKRRGFLMQTNVHVAAKDEATARLAVRTAYASGVEDVIAFDYWCAELEALKAEARKKAMAAAKEKSAFLLQAFDGKPRLINLQERTHALYPRSMYRSFESAYAQGLQIPYRDRNTMRISAFRPKNFYLEGFAGDVDRRDPRLPMQAEVSVISTIRLYYESPGKATRR